MQAVTESDSLAANVQQLLELAREHLGVDVAFIGRLLDGKRVFTHVASDGGTAPVPGDHDPLEATYCQRIVDGRLPTITSDTGAVAELVALPVTDALQIRSYLGVPLHLSTGETYGTLCCYSRHTGDLDDQEIGVARFLGSLIMRRLEPLLAIEAQQARLRDHIDAVVASGGPSIVLQPIIDLASEEVVGHEALSRFPSHESWGPQHWFDAAKATGRGPELEASAIAVALARLADVPAGTYLTINVSADALLSQRVHKLFAADAGERVVIEITEHEETQDRNGLRTAMQHFRTLGIRFALDDFGSGYAGLERLVRLGPELVKLDQALVRGVDRDPARRAVVASSLQFTRDVGAELVAEGIETTAELEVLRELGVTRGQGYLLGRPGPQPARSIPSSAAATATPLRESGRTGGLSRETGRTGEHTVLA